MQCKQLLFLGLCLIAMHGCAGRSQILVSNPVFIPLPDHESVWEEAVGVMHQYHFPIARENKLEGLIETEYEVGAGAVEPWHKDSVGAHNRLEGSLQSIRRKALVHVTPADGGYLVGVEVFKELEDVGGMVLNSPGSSTFHEAFPFHRDLNQVVGQTAPSGWIAKGRDPDLEQEIMRNLQANFGL